MEKNCDVASYISTEELRILQIVKIKNMKELFEFYKDPLEFSCVFEH